MGIVLPYNDPTLVAILKGDKGGSGTAAASPYVIAMQNFGIGVLPHIISSLMVTSIFSAGNTYTFCATRTLYALVLDGRAPKVLTNCTKSGIPIWSFCIVMLFPFLSFLQVSSSLAQVLTWLVNLITAGGIIDYIIMSITYLAFYYACQAQGLGRNTLPYTGWIGLVGEILTAPFYGCSSFTPLDVETFFTYYTMVIVAPLLHFGWNIFKHTKRVRSIQEPLDPGGAAFWPPAPALRESFRDAQGCS